MYNFLLAFTVCGAAVIIGELVSSWTKAWVPSVFVTACLFLLGYWTVLPHDLIKDSYLIPFGGTICVNAGFDSIASSVGFICTTLDQAS